MTEHRIRKNPDNTLRLKKGKIGREKTGCYPPEELQALMSTEEDFQRVPEETRQILHELRTHQIELEMQNAELRRLQEELEASHGRYVELYELAPLGYFTINDKGMILEANITTATLLGKPRDKLITQPLTRFILSEYQDVFYLQHKTLIAMGKKQAWEMEMLGGDGSRFWAHLQAVRGRNGECRIAFYDITESKKAEKALLESEARYRRITEDLTDYQFAVRLENGLAVETIHSLACISVTGYSAEEFAADPYLWILMVTPDDRQLLTEHMQQILEGKDSKLIKPLDHKIIRKDGELRWVRLKIIPYLDYLGNILSYDGVIKDITDRKRVEAINQALLQETKSQFEQIAGLMRASRTVLEDRDFETATRVIFDECKQLLGATAGYVALLNSDRSDNEILFLDSGGGLCTVPPDLPMPIRGLRGEVYRTGKTVFDNDFKNSERMDNNPCGHMTLDNVLFAPLPLHSKIVGLLGFANKPGGFTEEDARTATAFGEIVALAFDNSNNLKSLENSEARFRSLVETATDAIVSVDAEGCITHWNRGAENIFGYTGAETIGRNISLIVPQSSRDAHSDAIKRAVTGGKLQHPGIAREVFGKRKDGSEVPVEINVSQWRTKEGIFLTSIIRDGTERKRIADEKTRLETHLRQAQKMEAIGLLAGGIAHDFNNILGAIMGFTDLAREAASPGSQAAKDLERVILSAHRAKDLVKQILTFSRQSNVDRIPIKIQPLVKESLKMLRASIPATITIKENIYPKCEVVLADPSEVYQIVMNLCTNAFHAMERTGGQLNVEVEPCRLESEVSCHGAGLLPPGEYVALTVSDTGIGIEPDTMDKIFNPYFTTKEVGKGTGMGLAITYGIIKSYGGDITVESVVGQGTTFHIYFPIIHAEEMVIEELRDSPGGMEKILFVDDEKLLTELGRKLMERLGYTVTTRHSSIEALELFNNDPAKFDLVITDQTMPGMTGTELARRMLMIRPDLPIILCTGFSYLVNEELAKAIGIREFALKPLTKFSIAKLIRKIFDEKPASRPE